MTILSPEKAEMYLRRLCLEIANRRVGSEGNRVATKFFANIMSSFGFAVECQPFDCVDWGVDGVSLTVDGASFEVLASPYSLGCKISAPLSVVSTVEELDAAEVSDKVVLLRGEIAREQLMPKNFPFFSPDGHKRIIQLLEAKKPAAIITASPPGNVDGVGAVYPFPLIEDGDFDIPSIYTAEEEGNRLADQADKNVWLESRVHRIPATGCNVIARKGTNQVRRVVFFAHIDAKAGSPGAIDNASGVIVLILLAQLLADYDGNLAIEIVALNGEDYYSNPGEQQYLTANAGRFAEVALGINVDGAGYYRGNTAYSLYDCPPSIASAMNKAFSSHKSIVQGEPWYQGDHSLFLKYRRPALAITSERVLDLLNEVIHTPKDSPEIVDSAKLVEAAVALRGLVLHMNELSV